MRKHLADNDPATLKQRRPSINKIVGNALVLGLVTFILLIASVVDEDHSIRARLGYALGETYPLKTVVAAYYDEHQHWPASDAELGVSTRAAYPDGGYYELEEEGAIRIRFTVIPELKKGSIVLSPQLEEGFLI